VTKLNFLHKPLQNLALSVPNLPIKNPLSTPFPLSSISTFRPLSAIISGRIIPPARAWNFNDLRQMMCGVRKWLFVNVSLERGAC
jgi:hypothetical protein